MVIINPGIDGLYRAQYNIYTYTYTIVSQRVENSGNTNESPTSSGSLSRMVFRYKKKKFRMDLVMLG